MKIIHCSDLHLDSKIDGLPTEKSRIRREELLQAVERLVDFAINNDVNVIIIAGDMFDSEKISIKTRNRILQLIKKNHSIDFLYLSGNHDEDGFISNIDEDIKNLKLFEEQWTKFRYEKVVISGVKLTKFNQNTIYDTLNLNSDDVNIVTMHGQVAGYKSQMNAELISIPRLKDKNIDYLALGHIHSYNIDKIDERGVFAYAGCLEGRGFDETGEKGFVLLDINDKHVKSSFVPFAQRKLYEYEYDITGEESWYSARDKLIKELEESITETSLIKVVLKGEKDADFDIDINGLSMLLNRNFFFAKIYDKTQLKISISDYELDKSVRGEFVRLVYNSDLPLDEKEKVIMCGINALKGEEI